MKYRKMLLIVLVMVLIVSIGKETYALFTNEVSSVVQSYSTGTLKLSYSSDSISLNNAYPLSDIEGMNQDECTITITNIGTLAYKFNVVIEPSSDSTISTSLIRVSIDDEDSATLSLDGNIIIRDVILNPGSSRTFTIKLWISDSASSSDVLNKKFSAGLTSTGIAIKNIEDSDGIVLTTPTLYGYIKRNANITTQIDFSKTSEVSKTNGIYVTTNTGSNNPVYYYRGNVDNHLIFADFCWRIVRTTETGGVKLIYDGVPSNGQCNNTGDATTIGNYQFNSKYISPAYGGYMYGAAYTTVRKTMSLLSGSIVFGNDITYANGTYTLKDTYTLTDASNWSTEYTKIASKYHYTCFTSSDTCEKVDYIHYTSDLYSTYFEFSNGEDHINALKEMLDNSTNENDSTIKTAVDTWYKNNMTNYTSQLEDIVFCNDRSYDASKTGWNKDYSNAGSYLYFDAYQRIGNFKPSLVCKNNNDKFTVEKGNGNGLLTYPVGLLTADEVVYAGGKNGTANPASFYLNNNQDVWALSPDYSGSAYIYEFILTSSGYLHVGSVNSSYGVRPVISLKPGTILSSGSGTATEPLVID